MLEEQEITNSKKVTHLKIRVPTEDDTKEAQELLFKLGYQWNGTGEEVHPNRTGFLITKENEEKNIIRWFVTNEGDAFKNSDAKEVTLEDLQRLVKQKEEGENMKETLKENNLLTPQQAKLAWANGEDVECKYKNYPDHSCWYNLNNKDSYKEFGLGVFDQDSVIFRLKPRTITLNGVEIPAPFKPKIGNPVWFIDDNSDCGYLNSWEYDLDISSFYGFWRSEQEIKQVVAALKSVFNCDKE